MMYFRGAVGWARTTAVSCLMEVIWSLLHFDLRLIRPHMEGKDNKPQAWLCYFRSRGLRQAFPTVGGMFIWKSCI